MEFKERVKMTDAEYQAIYGWFDGDFSGTKSTERVRKYAEVFTPRWMAEKMIDEIPGCENPTSTVFEPACGEGAFLACVLRRKLARASRYADKIRACQTCYGIDIQYDNVTACRAKLVQIAMDAGVCRYDAEFIFARNIIHGDMIFFPMLARFYDWKERRWTNLEEMSNG